MEPAADLFAVAVFQLLPNELEADVLVESAAADDVSELDLEAEVVQHGSVRASRPNRIRCLRRQKSSKAWDGFLLLACFRKISPANLSDFFNTTDVYDS
jgi:hypothetical protein